jgi:hypothetical protein
LPHIAGGDSCVFGRVICHPKSPIPQCSPRAASQLLKDIDAK